MSLNAEQSAAQRDQCVRDLYSILFAFIIETANHIDLSLLDQPGFQTRGPSGTTSMSLSGTMPLVSVAKLLSGPSLAAERHHKDEIIIVQSQVSSRPRRQPTSILSPTNTPPSAKSEHPNLDPNKTYPVTAQTNFTLSKLFSSLDRTRLWHISYIRPNDFGSSNSFDKRRAKAQIWSLLLPNIASRRSAEYVVDYELDAFCELYVPTMRGSDIERITQCARVNG